MMKCFMRFIQGVDRFQQTLRFIENYQDIRMRQADIDWLKGNKRYCYIEHHIGLKVIGDVNGFMWVDTDVPWNYFSKNKIKEVFYNPDIIILGELSCTI